MHWFFKFLFAVLIILSIWVLFTEIIPRILPPRTMSDTEVYGIQLQSEIWQGTIHITGDLITPHGASITVLPGTRIIINKDGDRSNLDLLPWHLKAGLNTGKYYFGVRNGEYFWDESQKIHLFISKFIAIGTKEQPIIITSNTNIQTGSPYDISAIKISQGVLSNVIASNYRRMEIGDRVTVRSSTFTNVAECALCVISSDPSIIKNYFGKALREDIWVGGGDPQITDNYFSSDGVTGIRVDPEITGEPLISHNDFEMPLKLAIDISTGDEDHGGEISYNIFSGNSTLKIACDSRMNIFNNDIFGIVTFPVGGCASKLSIGPNFWGTNNISQIYQAKVLKKDPNLVFSIPAVLNSPPPGVGPR